MSVSLLLTANQVASGIPTFASLVYQPGGTYTFALLVARILRFVSVSPRLVAVEIQLTDRTTTGASLLSSLEAFLKPAVYSSLSAEARGEFVDILVSHHWVGTCVEIINDIVAASVST